jgi:hypothetical protein
MSLDDFRQQVDGMTKAYRVRFYETARPLRRLADRGDLEVARDHADVGDDRGQPERLHQLVLVEQTATALRGLFTAEQQVTELP